MGNALSGTVDKAYSNYMSGQKQGQESAMNKQKMAMSEEDLSKAQRENEYENADSSEEGLTNFENEKRQAQAKIAAEANKFNAEADKARQHDNVPKTANVWKPTEITNKETGEIGMVNEATGETKWIPGSASGKPPKEPNEVALKASGHLARAVAADQGYSGLTEPQTDPKTGVVKAPVYDPTARMTAAGSSMAQAPVVGSLFKNNNNTQARQYEDDFIASAAREDITRMNPDVIENARKLYFPQAGDKPQAVANKSATRKRIIAQIQAEAANAPVLPPITAKQVGRRPANTATAAPNKDPNDMTEAELDAYIASKTAGVK